MALWDIAGRRAGMPVYELLGGRVRTAAPVYLHAGGATIPETLDQARAIMETGVTHVRTADGAAGFGSYGTPRAGGGYPGAPHPTGGDVQHYPARHAGAVSAGPGRSWARRWSCCTTSTPGLTPKQAVTLARALEPYRLFFLEDVSRPSSSTGCRRSAPRPRCPYAAGELLHLGHEAARLVLGGGWVTCCGCTCRRSAALTPASALVALCEFSRGTHRLALPADVSPSAWPPTSRWTGPPGLRDPGGPRVRRRPSTTCSLGHR
ncbi:hypothetical protein GCM10018952_37840 [Streptosporangium vulgare]